MLATASPRNTAFTLVELMIVMLLLGLLAALVIPQFSNAGDIARASALRQEVKIFRTQIQMYRAQHNGVSPGHTGGAAVFESQLLGHTDIYGNVSDQRTDTHLYGPYFTRIPANPFNLRRDVRILAADAAAPTEPVGAEAWLFHPGTGRLFVNLAGVDHDGVRFFDY